MQWAGAGALTALLLVAAPLGAARIEVGAPKDIDPESLELPSVASQHEPAAAYLDGRWLVAFSDGRDGAAFYGRFVDAAGSPLGSAAFPIASGPFSSGVALAAGPGGWLAVWVDRSDVVLARRIDAAGDVLDDPPIALGGCRGAPAVGFDGSNWVVAWDFVRGPEFEATAWVTRIGADGSIVQFSSLPLSSLESIARRTVTLASEPAVSTVGWANLAGGYDVVRLDAAGRALDDEPVRIVPAPQRLLAPALAVSGDHRWLFFTDEATLSLEFWAFGDETVSHPVSSFSPREAKVLAFGGGALGVWPDGDALKLGLSLPGAAMLEQAAVPYGINAALAFDGKATALLTYGDVRELGETIVSRAVARVVTLVPDATGGTSGGGAAGEAGEGTGAGGTGVAGGGGTTAGSGAGGQGTSEGGAGAAGGDSAAGGDGGRGGTAVPDGNSPSAGAPPAGDAGAPGSSGQPQAPAGGEAGLAGDAGAAGDASVPPPTRTSGVSLSLDCGCRVPASASGERRGAWTAVLVLFIWFGRARRLRARAAAGDS